MNVLIADERRGVLCDFGLALAADEVQAGLTTSNGLKGSLRYCSSELVVSDERRSWSSDMWAWGCALVEASGLRVQGLGLPDLIIVDSSSQQIMKETVPYASIRSEITVLIEISKGRLPESGNVLKEPVDLWPIVQECWQAEPHMRSNAKTTLRRLRPLVR